MPQVQTSLGPIAYRTAGPQDPSAPTAVFVHGVLVDGRLWDGVVQRVAAAGVRCVVPDLPLGSHRLPMAAGADRSAPGVARGIADLLEALELTDVTLVGNDTGGALCQFVLDAHGDRVGRLVLTNCDAFDTFPPQPFDLIFKVFRGSPGRIHALAAPMGLKALRHSPLGYGLLARRPDPALTASWIEPVRREAPIRRDLADLLEGLRPAELNAVSGRMDRVAKPVRFVWGMADKSFKPALGRRLHDRFPHAEWRPVDGALTFVALDAPDAVADAVASFA